MKIELFVSTDRNLHHLTGITHEAVSRGHEVSVFVMDAGARLLLNDELAGLCRLKGVSVTCCNLSLAQLGIEPSAIPPEVKRGSQYDNAGLMNAADHVISL